MLLVVFPACCHFGAIFLLSKELFAHCVFEISVFFLYVGVLGFLVKLRICLWGKEVHIISKNKAKILLLA